MSFAMPDELWHAHGWEASPRKGHLSPESNDADGYAVPMTLPLFFDAVLFDLDGTLVATHRFWLQAARTGVRQGLECLGLERAVPTPAEWMSIVGLTSEEGFAKLFPELASEQRQVLQEACEVEQERLLKGGMGALMPGAEALLKRLGSAGLKLGIASNCGNYYLEQMQQTLGLGNYFDEAYCIDSPAIYNKGDMLERLLLDFGTRSAVMVGDRAGDRAAAWENGLPAVHCAFGFSGEGEGQGAEACIEDLGELWELLERRGRWITAILEQAGALGPAAKRPSLVLGITGDVASGKTLFARDVVRLLTHLGHSARCVSLDDFKSSRGPALGPGDFDLERLEQEVLGPHGESGGYLVLEGPYLLDPRLQSRLDRSIYLEVTEEVMWRRLTGLQAREKGLHALSDLRTGLIPAIQQHRQHYDPTRLADLLVEASNPLGPAVPSIAQESSQDSTRESTREIG